MSISNEKMKAVAEAIIDSFIEGKSAEKLSSIDQEEVDVFIVPIMDKIESMITQGIMTKVSDACSKASVGTDTPWWEID